MAMQNPLWENSPFKEKRTLQVQTPVDLDEEPHPLRPRGGCRASTAVLPAVALPSKGRVSLEFLSSSSSSRGTAPPPQVGWSPLGCMCRKLDWETGGRAPPCSAGMGCVSWAGDQCRTGPGGGKGPQESGQQKEATWAPGAPAECHWSSAPQAAEGGCDGTKNL